MQYNLRNSRPKLAIIGASYLQKPLVLKARELGFETHVFAWEEGAVCKPLADQFYPVSTTDIDEILRICRTIQPQGIVSIGSDLATVAVNQVADKLGLIGNSPECTELTTNKFLMREKLYAKGIPGPRYWHLEAQTAFPSFAEADFPLIVKPVDRSGSRGVSLVQDPAGLAPAIEDARDVSFHSGVIIEQYIEGRELSVEAISWQSKHYILQFTDKETTGAPHFIEKAHHQPAHLDDKTQSAISRIVIQALEALELQNGASHSELKIDPQGKIFIIEIGARMGGDCIGSHLVELSTGYDFLMGVIEVATGRFTPPVKTIQKHSGIHYVFPRPGLFNALVFKGGPQIVDHEVIARIGDRIPKIRDSSQRPGYYIYEAERKLEFEHGMLVINTAGGEDDNSL